MDRLLYIGSFTLCTSQVLEYNVPGGDSTKNLRSVNKYLFHSLPGKCNRGLMVIGSLRHLAQDRILTEDEEKKALILGWCIEWVHSYMLGIRYCGSYAQVKSQ